MRAALSLAALFWLVVGYVFVEPRTFWIIVAAACIIALSTWLLAWAYGDE